MSALDVFMDDGFDTVTPAPAPAFVDPIPDFPEALKQQKIWLVWKAVAGKNGKTDKVPYHPLTGKKTNDPKQAVTFKEAVANLAGYTGLGIYIGGGLIVVDLDGCVDLQAQTFAPDAYDIVTTLNSYTELSHSKSGLHTFIYGKKPGRLCRKNNVEIYGDKRFLAVGGTKLQGVPATIETRDITPIYEKYLVEAAVESPAPKTTPEAQTQEQAPAKTAPRNKLIHHHGAFTNELTLLMTGDFIEGALPFTVADEDECNTMTFDSQSEGIASLLFHLAGKHNCDPEKINDEFLTSALYQGITKWNATGGKWDRLGKAEIAGAIKKYKAGHPSASTVATSQAPAPAASLDSVESSPDSLYDMTPEEVEAQYEAEYPVFRLRESAGPVFEDSDLYGLLGQVAKLICQQSEAHVVTVYLNLIVSIGNLFGRGAYFNIAQTRHFTNENLACVGDTSRARKGSASDGAESFLRVVDSQWLSMRNVSGFATPQAVISEIRDNDEFQKLNSKTKQYETIHREGVADKRLCIREGELSNVFKLMSDVKQKSGELVRNLWDSKPVSNKVAGKSADGEHNSLMCREPHVSIVGSTTPSLAKATLPIGADKSGDGNRFIWCYTKRTQLCPNGGPQIDWASVTIEYAGKTVSLLVYMQEMLRDVVFGDSEVSLGYRLIPLTKAAAKFWLHLYLRLEKDQREGFLGGMTSRAAAHIRRLAMILSLVDREGAVDVKHLKAAEAIWNYSQESACFIFKGYSLEQEKILRYAHEKGTAGIKIDRDLYALFNGHKSSEWLRAQMRGLVETGYLTEVNGVYKFKKF